MPTRKAGSKRRATIAKGARTSTSKRSRRLKPAKAAVNDHALRDHLLSVLRGGGAHLDFEKVTAGLPARLRGTQLSGIPFTAWGLLEHMRIAQRDILEFSRNPNHVSPEWPSGYWPQTEGPPNEEAWQKSVQAFRADLKAMQKLVADPAADLFARIPHGEGQTLLREALLVADHNAYHLGQLVMLRRLLEN